MKFKTGLAAVAAIMALNLSPQSAYAEIEPYIGEIAPVGGTYCPRGWLPADGRLISVNANDALFSLFGTIYGGDGRSTFALPDLRGRSPMSRGHGTGLSERRLGARGGAENNTLNTSNLPSHNHKINTTETLPNTNDPNGSVFATFDINGDDIYTNGNPPDQHQMAANAMTNTGANQQVNNMAPYQVIRYCVATGGVYPSRN